MEVVREVIVTVDVPVTVEVEKVVEIQKEVPVTVVVEKEVEVVRNSLGEASMASLDGAFHALMLMVTTG